MDGTTVPVRITGPGAVPTCHGSGAEPGHSADDRAPSAAAPARWP